MLKATITSALMSLVKNYIYTSKSGLVKGLKRKGGLGFIPRPLTREEKFLMNLDLNGQTIYDIGGLKVFSPCFLLDLSERRVK